MQNGRWELGYERAFFLLSRKTILQQSKNVVNAMIIIDLLNGNFDFDKFPFDL